RIACTDGFDIDEEQWSGSFERCFPVETRDRDHTGACRVIYQRCNQRCCLAGGRQNTSGTKCVDLYYFRIEAQGEQCETQRPIRVQLDCIAWLLAYLSH